MANRCCDLVYKFSSSLGFFFINIDLKLHVILNMYLDTKDIYFVSSKFLRNLFCI